MNCMLGFPSGSFLLQSTLVVAHNKPLASS